MTFEGIKFIVDDKGKKTAVIIDLEKYGELWEDIYDYIICLERENEPRETLEEVKAKLRKPAEVDA
ncbi:MAG: hypothetical protein B1H03_06315 [Planctomycetales bacterium 4484_113]|nr:MAG: hypothetical protein B1H03_06315 [Planctomycetales bacterium 4484_113]